MKRLFTNAIRLSVILLLLLNFGIEVSAAPGDLDLTFSDDGLVVEAITPNANYATAMAIQPDGKIIAVGSSRSDTLANFDVTVVRFNEDGSLDPSFSLDGIQRIPIVSSISPVVTSVAIQSDGKILVAGYVFDGVGNIVFLIRFNTDGVQDFAFGSNSFVFTQIANGNGLAHSVTVQNDGKIVVGGQANQIGTSNLFMLIRYSPNGSLDTTFDSDGIVLTSVMGANSFGRSVATQADGKIVLAGFMDSGTGFDFAVVRFNPDGSLDTSFDSDGTSTADFWGLDDFGRKVAIQPDGKIIVVGEAFNGNDYDFGVVRFNPDGTLDPTFDTDGIVTTQILNNYDYATSVAVQFNGKIVVGGYTFNATIDFAVVRYNADGSLDDSLWNSSSNKLFGTGGIVLIDFGTSDLSEGMALDSMGRIVLAGRSNNNFALARVLGDFVPTAANVSVSGKVINPDGRAIPRALVSMTDTSGQVRTAITNSFGYFRFEEVEVGEVYIFNVRAKGYAFSTEILKVNDELNELIFTANNQSNLIKNRK